MIAMVQAQAQLIASLDRYPEALQTYDRVVSYRPEQEGVLLGRAELLVRMDRVDAAIVDYRKAIKLFPDSAAVLNALGYTLADRTARFAEASRLIRKALKIEPDSPAIIDSYGWVLYKQGKFERALSQLQRAYSLLRDGEVAAHTVATLVKLERMDEARQVLAAAESESPDNPLLKSLREREFAANPD